MSYIGEKKDCGQCDQSGDCHEKPNGGCAHHCDGHYHQKVFMPKVCALCSLFGDGSCGLGDKCPGFVNFVGELKKFTDMFGQIEINFLGIRPDEHPTSSTAPSSPAVEHPTSPVEHPTSPAESSSAKIKSGLFCIHGSKCTTKECPRTHFEDDQLTKKIKNVAWSPEKVTVKGDKKYPCTMCCKYGKGCTNEGCKFIHPDDLKAGGLSDEEITKVLNKLFGRN